ncbi:MAG: HD domain-containing protein, partial [Chloroflexota bacterium]
MSKLGTTAWANRTNGDLSIIDKILLLKQEVQRQINTQLRRIQQTEIAYVEAVDLDTIPLPDTTLARESQIYCKAVSPKSLFFHSLRTYYWGSILARQNNIKLDAELFYVMALFHDIGLCDAHNNQDNCSQCFAVEGGRSARAFITDQGFPQKADHVEAAIIQHLNLDVPVADGPEHHILPHATALDVVGARIGEIKPSTLSAVIERYPRLDFKKDLINMFNREYENRPQSRIAFMQQVANLNRLIQNAPF